MGLTDPNEHTKYSLDILLQVNMFTDNMLSGFHVPIFDRYSGFHVLSDKLIPCSNSFRQPL